MKGKIDRAGCLYIERAGKVKKQRCPFYGVTEEFPDPAECGDWCPLFGEPMRETYIDDYGKNKSRIVLALCHKTHEFNEFTDEREGE